MARKLAIPAKRIQRRAGRNVESNDGYRFVIVPKVTHAWFDLVHEGARDAAEYLKKIADIEVTVDFCAPRQASVVEQNRILKSVIESEPDGIAIDLLDSDANRPVLEDVQNLGIRLVVFDSVPPEGMIFTAIGNDFCQQAKIASERLAQILGGRGKVAIMQGVPTAPNHRIRYDCHKEVFQKYRDIVVVAEGVDNDNIEQAKQQATAIMRAHPDLEGWVACDAAGPIGIGRAIKEAGLAGQVKLVGLDNLPEMLTLIKDGLADSSSSTRPRMLGFYSVMMLYDSANGVPTPKTVDTGVLFITPDDLEGELR